MHGDPLIVVVFHVGESSPPDLLRMVQWVNIRFLDHHRIGPQPGAKYSADVVVSFKVGVEVEKTLLFWLYKLVESTVQHVVFLRAHFSRHDLLPGPASLTLGPGRRTVFVKSSCRGFVRTYHKIC